MMKYLVMECHPGYAVVLSSKGEFLKVANLGYQIGQQLSQVTEMNHRAASSRLRPLTVWAAAAACFCFIVMGVLQLLFSPIGTVEMRINPAVSLSVNRWNHVVKAEGLNQDGQELLKDLPFFWVKVEELTDQLAEKAMDTGVLHEGGEITLSIQSEDQNWQIATEQLLVLELEVQLRHKVVIKTTPTQTEEEESSSQAIESILIPALPSQPQDSSVSPEKQDWNSQDEDEWEDDIKEDETEKEEHDQEDDEEESDDDEEDREEDAHQENEEEETDDMDED